MNKLETILFDFDGVLVESLTIKTQAFYDMYLPYGIDVANYVVDFHLKHGGVSRFEKFKLYHQECLGVEITESEMHALVQDFSNRVLEGVVKSNEVAGAENFFKKYESKLNFHIITGTPTVEIIEILKQRNWSQYFKNAFGSPENKIYWVDKLLTDKIISAPTTVFLGDAMADYEAAVSGEIAFFLRNHDENDVIFEKINCPRFVDFESFEEIIQSKYIF